MSLLAKTILNEGFTSQYTYESSYPTWRKQVAGVYEAGFIPIRHAKRQKDGAYDNLNDRDDFQHSSVIPHFTAQRGEGNKAIELKFSYCNSVRTIYEGGFNFA